jgi:hypothetical protein
MRRRHPVGRCCASSDVTKGNVVPEYQQNLEETFNEAAFNRPRLGGRLRSAGDGRNLPQSLRGQLHSELSRMQVVRLPQQKIPSLKGDH